MDWIRENKTVASIMGVFLALALVLGFFVFNAWSALGASRDRFGVVNNGLAAMKSADLFPSPENRDKKKAAVETYEKKVNALSTVLLSLQPEVKPISETDFQAKLKAKIAEVRGLAGTTTKLPPDFALAFAEYTASLPKSAAIAEELSDYLDATDAVVRTLIGAGVQSIDTFERSQLSSEKGEPAPPPTPPPAPRGGFGAKRPSAPVAPVREVAKMVERRTLTLTLTTDQGPLQTVLNDLASPSKMPYFAAVRLARVQNEKNEGPLRTAVAQELARNTANLSTEDPNAVPPENVVISPEGNPVPTEAAPASNTIEAAKPGVKDAVGVLGQEKLKVYLEIDLIRFLDPNAAPAGAEAAPSK